MIEDMSIERRVVRQLFGDAARIIGSIGSGRHPGRLTVLVDGRPLGSGGTLEAALQRATKRAAGLAVGVGPGKSADG
jgi:hypothetical protein